MTLTGTIDAQHTTLLQNLISAVPDSERARELRAMLRRLEQIKPELERRRIDAMSQRLEIHHA